MNYYHFTIFINKKIPASPNCKTGRAGLVEWGYLLLGVLRERRFVADRGLLRQPLAIHLVYLLHGGAGGFTAENQRLCQKKESSGENGQRYADLRELSVHDSLRV